MLVRADLHIHTVYSSDSTISPKMLIREALSKGLNVIAVTDHNVYDGAIETKRLTREFEDELLVLIGVELLTDDGEIIILSHEPLDRLPRELNEAIDYARQHDSVIIVPHPFDEWRYGIKELVYSVDHDAIEVFNPKSSSRANRLAHEAAKALGKAQVASSDAHSIEYVGIAYTVIEVNSLCEDEVFKAIRRGRVKPIGRYPELSERVRSGTRKVLWKLGLYNPEEY